LAGTVQLTPNSNPITVTPCSTCVLVMMSKHNSHLLVFSALCHANQMALALHVRPVASALDSVKLDDPAGLETWYKPNDPAPQASFRDVLEEVFPDEWYKPDEWNADIKHSGTFYPHSTAPAFPDLNGDGKPDFFNNMHLSVGDPQFSWDIGKGILEPQIRTAVKIEECTHDTIKYLMDPKYEQYMSKDGKPTPGFKRRDKYGKLTQFSEDKDGELTQWMGIDPHGVAFVDIDRDGVLDLHVTNGAGQGKGHGFQHHDLVFWGVQNKTSSCGINFAGGRSTAQAANLHNPDGRTRFAYWADVNNDGFLDVFLSNLPRSEGRDVPGVLMMNQGNRTFAPDLFMQGWIEALVLHDVDGDGYAQEFLAVQKDCDRSLFNQSGTDGFGCSLGTPLVAYKYNKTLGRMETIPHGLGGATYGAGYAKSFATGDFDGDQAADLVVLYQNHLAFYYSTRRTVLGDIPDYRLELKQEWNCTMGTGDQYPGAVELRAADFDLDGKTDLLLVCTHAGSNLIFMQREDQVWEMKGKLGEIDAKFIDPDDDNQGEWDGASVVDFNNDGYSDVALVSHGHLHMFQNPWHTTMHRFIAIELQGTASNTHGIGATIELQGCNHGYEWSDRATNHQCFRQLREVNCVGHEVDRGGYRDGRHIFGLGKHGVPLQMIIFWPAGGLQKTGHVQVVSGEQLSAHVGLMEQPFLIKEEE